MLLKNMMEKFSKGGINISNLRFADDKSFLAEEEQKLQALVESSTKRAQGTKWRSVQRRPN